MKAKYITIDGSQTQIKTGPYMGHQLKELGKLSSDAILLFDNKGEVDVPIGDDHMIIIDGGEQFVTAQCHELPDNPCYQKPIQYELNCVEHAGDEGIRHAKVTGRDILASDPSINANDKLFIDIDGVVDELFGLDQILIVHRPLTFTSVPCGNVGDSVQVPSILEQHFTRVRERFPDAKLERSPHGGYLLIIEQYPLPDHWSTGSVNLCVQVPPGYPSTPLDMFFVSPHITLANGRPPDRGDHNVTLGGRVWQRFSWHYQNRPWNVNVDSLLSHLRFCRTRLALAH